MADSYTVYTYRAGKKLPLRKRANQFVIRRVHGDVPDAVREDGRALVEQMSPSSSRVTCSKKELDKLMTAAREVAPTHHAYEDAANRSDFLITDRVFVEFKETPDRDAVTAFAADYALEAVHQFTDREYVFRLTNHTGQNPIKLVVQLTEQDKRVANADNDCNVRTRKQVILPSDPSYASQWHLHLSSQDPDFDARASSRCEQAWQALDHFGDPDVVVAVTDDGCQLDHPDFGDAGKFAEWGYFESTTLHTMNSVGSSPSGMYQTGANHGTSCAGVIAADINAALTVGAAPDCRLLPIKWESSGASLFVNDFKFRKMLDFVADRIDVMSNSWGNTPLYLWPSSVLNRIADLAQNGGRRGLGIVFLWAAGNENCPILHTANEDVPFTDGWEPLGNSWVWAGVETARVFDNNLVGLPGVMHVAALASTAQRSHYSNYGPGIGITAPTNNLHKYHRLSLAGTGITTTTGSDNQVTHDFGGTSSATPLVAGVAALVISANPQLSAVEVISILKETASKDLDFAGYPRTPPATFDPNPTWDVSPIAPFADGGFIDNGDAEGTWSPWFGHGRVDALGSVRRARELAGDRTTHVRHETVPELSIPDADPAGVVSAMFISSTGHIQQIAVHVDIEHTYRGDLIVAVVSPQGTRVELHHRTEGGLNNLHRTYDTNTTPALASLHGEEISGTWLLQVSDRAAIDVGLLHRWSVEADLLGDGVLRVSSTPGRNIPDDDPDGIVDAISVADTRAITEIEVDIDITHTWIADLLVELRHNDKTVTLHDRGGEDSDNIIRSYSTADTDFDAILGEAAEGTWELHVSDNAGQDLGKLNHWGLKIR